MTQRFYLRTIAIPLMVAVFILGVQVVAHYDGNGHDEAHCTCQVCHIAHAAIPQPAAQAQVEVALHAARFALPETSAATVESTSISSIPRAPPA